MAAEQRGRSRERGMMLEALLPMCRVGRSERCPFAGARRIERACVAVGCPGAETGCVGLLERYQLAAGVLELPSDLVKRRGGGRRKERPR